MLSHQHVHFLNLPLIAGQSDFLFFYYYKKKFKKIKNIDPILEKNLINLDRQFLHAKIIGFIHPKKNKEMIFDSILPQELEIILEILRKPSK